MIRLVLVVFCVGAMVGISAGETESGGPNAVRQGAPSLPGVGDGAELTGTGGGQVPVIQEAGGPSLPGVGSESETRTDADQAYGPLPEPDYKRTEWPYFVDAAIAFWIVNGEAGGGDHEDPNYCGLSVSKTSRDVRSILEYDLSMIPDEFERITFETFIRNRDDGDPVETVEFYHFVGNAETDDADWDVGDYYWTLDYAFSIPEFYQLSVDITDLVAEYKSSGDRYLGFRLSSPDDFARFDLARSLAGTSPCPYLRVVSPLCPVNADDYAYFEWCMCGPGSVYEWPCLIFWDFDDDEDVDLADFAVFQTLK